MAHPSDLIDAIRKSYVHAETVYTMGGCYQFHLILKTVFLDAVAWYSPSKAHVLTMIDGTLYDINGSYGMEPDLVTIDSDRSLRANAEDWRFDWGMVGTDFGEIN